MARSTPVQFHEMAAMRELRNLMASTDTIQQGVRLAGEVDHPVSAPRGCAARVDGPAFA